MITYDHSDSVYNTVCIRVEGRWYICDAAACTFSISHFETKFIYRTPTLKFVCAISNGFSLSGMERSIEMWGAKRDVKLEYI